MPEADEKKKEKDEDDAVDTENLAECCTAEFLMKKFHAASSIDEMIQLITEHQMKLVLQQQCAESALYTREEEAERNERPEEDILRARFHFLDELLEFEARKCKLDVALAALRVMKRGEMPFYQHEYFGECPICLEDMYENVVGAQCVSKPVAVHYPCCDNSLCYRCGIDLNRKVNDEMEQELQELLLLGERAPGPKKHAARLQSMLKCPFCRTPVAMTESERTEEHRRCADRTGDTLAQFEYGHRLLDGIGVKANPSEGKKWVVKAANGGNACAKMFLADEKLTEWEPGKVFPLEAKGYLKDVSMIGHPEGQFVLAAEEVWVRNPDLDDIGIEEIPKEAYDLLLLAAWQLNASAVSFLISCFVVSLLRSKKNPVDQARIEARLVLWAGRQTKYFSPFPGYHDILHKYGKKIAMDMMHRSTLPRALYWARRELVEAKQRNKNLSFKIGGIECRAGFDAKILKARIQRMEHFICSRCANCDQKPSKKIHLNFCNRCKAAKYCSKTCQVEHWKAGHKKECIDITKDQASKIPNRAPEYDELIDMIKKDAWESLKKKGSSD